MSHTKYCPDEWEARREGERAFEYGRSRSSNPYEDSYWNRDSACPDAAEAWSRGHRYAEIREEERQEEAAWRRAEAEAEEAAYYEQQVYYAAQRVEQYSEDEYIEDMCGSDGHVQYGEAGDRFGPRCYCGRVRWLLAAE